MNGKQFQAQSVFGILYLDMNFLGHHLFDQQEGRPIYNAGLLGPDLIRNASKGLFKPIWNIESEPRSWHQGACQHLKRDAWFHQHPFFKMVYEENRDAVRLAFLNAGIPRFYFGLHVAIEMSLDKALLAVYPQSACYMYADLEQALPTIADWLKQMGNQEVIAGVERFISSRYIERYQEDSDLAYGLMRVYLQTGTSSQEWSQEQLKIASGVMSQLVQSNRQHLPILWPA